MPASHWKLPLPEEGTVGTPSGGAHNSASEAANVVQAQNVHGDVHVHSTVNATNRGVVPRQLPATVRHFINRTVEQDALTTLLNGSGEDHTVLVSTIDGLAGVGKSALVVQWAHQLREQFSDGELYVNLRGFDPVAESVRPAEALTGFLIALGVAPEAIPIAEEAKAAQFRTLVHGRRMLLVLDNARDTEQVLPLLPGSSGCLVVVTSRQRLDGLVARHGAHRLALTTLTRSEGRTLLSNYVGADRLSDEPAAVEALLEHCAGLPLALTLVAVQAAAEPDVTLDDLAADLSDERDRLDTLDAGGKTGIRAVFSWSYRTLSPNAARLFRLLGLPNSPDISSSAAAALDGTNVRRTRRALAELSRAHLLTRRGGDRYVIHDLLRAYARERAHSDDTEDDREAALERLLDHHLYATYTASERLAPDRALPALEYTDTALWRDFPTYEEALAWWDSEYPCVLATIRQASALGMSRAAWLAHVAAYPFKLRGLIDEFHASSTAGLRVAEAQEDDPARARLLFHLGEAHHFLGEFDVGSHYMRQAADLFSALGERWWEALAHNVQGETFLEQELYAEAAASVRRALELADDLKGAPAVLGLALAHLGDFDAAFSYLRYSLDTSGSDGFATGYTLHALGIAHLLAGDTKNAVESLHRAVEHRHHLGQRVGEATSLTALGKAHQARDEFDDARNAWQAALTILEERGHHNVQVVRALLDTIDSHL